MKNIGNKNSMFYGINKKIAKEWFMRVWYDGGAFPIPNSLFVIESYKSLIAFVDDRPGHDRRYAIDATKIEKTLNWRAE